MARSRLKYACVGEEGLRRAGSRPTAELVNAPPRGKGSRLQSQQGLTPGFRESGSLERRNTGRPVCCGDVEGAWRCLSRRVQLGSGWSLPASNAVFARANETQPLVDVKEGYGVHLDSRTDTLPPWYLFRGSCRPPLQHSLGPPKPCGALGCRVGEGEPYAIWREVLKFWRGDVLIIWKRKEKNLKKN